MLCCCRGGDAVEINLSTTMRIIPPDAADKFTTQDGLKLHYEIWGAAPAPTLYFFHGFAESNETVHVQLLADAALRAGWRLVALESMGHGLSEGRRGVCSSLGHLVEHARQFVLTTSAQDTEKLAIAGNSMGGAVAAYLGDMLVANDQLRARLLARSYSRLPLASILRKCRPLPSCSR